MTTYELDLHTLRTTHTAPRWQLLIYYKLLDFFLQHPLILYDKKTYIFLTYNFFVVVSIILPLCNPFFNYHTKHTSWYIFFFLLASNMPLWKIAPWLLYFEIHALLSILDRKKVSIQNKSQLKLSDICAGNGKSEFNLWYVFLIREGLGVCLNERL